MQSTAKPGAAQPLLNIEGLAVSFDKPGSDRARAVDGLSLTIHPRQTLAVVGESGCGKSVSALSVMRLLPPAARIDSGRILLRRKSGETSNLTQLPERQLRAVRGGEAAMIFQEPMTSLNPVYTIGDQVIEAVLLHRRVSVKEAREIAARALTDVGIAQAGARMSDYPHQFSGGMRQRVMIAMALACGPSLLLADEPTTALDVTVQAQVLALLRSIQDSRGMGIMLITHALGVVAQAADTVCVMFAGRAVEYARVSELFARPLHPYTRGLMRCIPTPQRRVERLTTVRQMIDDPEQLRGLEPILGAGVRPWWPEHAPPALTPPPAQGFVSGDASALVEALPGHWVRVWRSAGAADGRETPPDLAPGRRASASPTLR